MSGKRQKNQLVLAFTEEGRSETPKTSREGTESLTAKCGTERPASHEQLIEEVCERGNCWQAYKRVKANKGSPGIDDRTVEDLADYLKQHWPTMREQRLRGTYKPQPVRRVEIPKPDGGVRKLGIPTVLDRLIQQAVMQVLQRRWDRTFFPTPLRLVSPAEEGTPQGGPLSPLVNEAKSAVARPVERKFLGFSFSNNKEPKRRISPKALLRCKQKIRELTRRTRGISREQMTKELTAYLRGWKGYFGYCQTPSVRKALDQWIRRRLRSAIWKQWKRGPTRFRKLRQRGVSATLIANTIRSCHGPWRMADSPALHSALPIAYFDSLGLPRLFDGPA
jgi:hypothetical protein